MLTRVPFDENLKNLWPKTSNPFLSYDWHKTWLKIFGQNVNPYILQDQNFIAPFKLENKTLKFLTDANVTDYHDTIGQSHWAEINELFSRFEFNSLAQSSSALEYYKNYPNVQIRKVGTTPILKLPRTWDEYLALLDNHNRHELRRKLRRFEENYRNLKIVTDANIENLLFLMKQNPEKKAFLTPPVERFFRKIDSKITDLLVNGKVVASSMSLESDKTNYLYNAGFDENYPGAGYYLNVMLIKQAIEMGITSYNFLRGNERYKYDLGGIDEPLYTISPSKTF